MPMAYDAVYTVYTVHRVRIMLLKGENINMENGWKINELNIALYFVK